MSQLIAACPVDKETLEKMGASQGAAPDVTKREDA